MTPMRSENPPPATNVAALKAELESAASLLETLAEDLPEDDVSAIMMSVMAKRNRAVLEDVPEPAPSEHLRVTNPDTIAQFVAALADHGVKLPLLETDEDVGTLVDADGKPVLVVDVDRERSDEDVAWIVGMIQGAVNTCGGFKAQRTATTEGSTP